MSRLHCSRCCLAIVLMFLLSTAAWSAPEEPPTEAKHTVSRSEAVRALETYQRDPLNNLKAASVFATYIKEDGDVHVSMDNRLIPWMTDPNCPPRVRAILLSAFMAGNFQAQLDDEMELDDSAAGLTYTVEVYELLKSQDATLMQAELEKLLAAKQEGKLEPAIDSLVNGEGEEAPQ